MGLLLRLLSLSMSLKQDSNHEKSFDNIYKIYLNILMYFSI